MSCCAPPRGKVDKIANVATNAIEIGSAKIAPRAKFEATRSNIGTSEPEIAADGEGPVRSVMLNQFSLDIHPTTNARFAEFVAATGYVTEAEQFGWSPVFQGLLGSGSATRPTSSATPWWVIVDGACWRAPEGEGSTIETRKDHPVVQVSWADASAFAAWAGGRLPSEAEWEHAARGGLQNPKFPWGDAEPDDATIYCNIWQGQFPHDNTMVDGFMGTCPVEAFAPNCSGLYGMAGNVWEWTGDAFKVRSLSRQAKARNEHARQAQEKVIKGGSFLCHISYCNRYRIAARSALAADSCSSNTGFRIAYDN